MADWWYINFVGMLVAVAGWSGGNIGRCGGGWKGNEIRNGIYLIIAVGVVANWWYGSFVGMLVAVDGG
jgi:hypothetical protein